MEIKKELGNKIKNLRLNQSLTQEGLAEKINISAKSLSQIELGNNFVSAETLEKICEALNITPKTLFDFGHSKEKSKDMLSEISKRLSKNKNLLDTVYRIVVALDG